MIKKKNKKGISPLIATVLVIGFTIVLAALVITWGTKLFKGTVAETETTAKFNLACTTGLRLDATADTNTDTDTQINLTLRNNNQDRGVTSFRFVLHRAGADPIDVSTAATSGDNTFAAWTGAWNASADGVRLAFPVPRVYRLNAAAGANLNTTLTGIDVYPIFTIEGTTKACENPVEVNLV